MKEVFIIGGGSGKATFAQIEMLKERGINIVQVEQPPIETYVIKPLAILEEPILVNSVKQERYASQTWKPKHKRA